MVGEKDYKKICDGDLYSVLKLASRSDLDDLVQYILKASTENLTENKSYKKYNPHHEHYYRAIGDEIRSFGGNSFANLFRGEGPPYQEIVEDVAKNIGANIGGGVVETETNILKKVFEDFWEELSLEDRKKFVDKIKENEGGSISATLPATAIMAQIGLRVLAVNVTSIVGAQLLGRSLGLLLGPVGWVATGVWTAIDLAGPAFRVTKPCVIQIAKIRQELIFAGLNTQVKK